MEPRRAAIGELLRRTGSVTVAELTERFHISSMTVRRDLSHLERHGLARRVHGGAVVPTTSRDADAPSTAADSTGKAAIAAAAVDRLAPGHSVFLDSSPTTYVVARRIVQERLGRAGDHQQRGGDDLRGDPRRPNLELIGIGGSMLRQRTRSFVGPLAVDTVVGHFVDWAFLSVKGIAADGTLTDADPLEADSSGR